MTNSPVRNRHPSADRIMQASRPAEQSTVFLNGRSKSRAPVVLQRRGAGFGYLPVLIRNIGRATAPTLQRPQRRDARPPWPPSDQGSGRASIPAPVFFIGIE
jgi:hypothetical protein